MSNGILNNADAVTISSDVILKRSSDSASMLEYWDKTDAIVDGAKTMYLAGETYLPKFADEGKKEYDIRLKLSKFTNIYRDIVEGLANKPFEEEVRLLKNGDNELPENLLEFIENVDGSGNNLTGFASLTFFNGINSAIDWIFIDYPVIDSGKIKTLADQKSSGVRPFWSHVLGRNVLEAKSSSIDGSETLTYVRIFEPGEPDRVRVFERKGNVVTWKLWVKTKDQAKFQLEQSNNLSIGVIPLVSFATGRRYGRNFRYLPAMQDAADLQIELYQEESGLKFAKTMTAYAMLAANGIRPEKGSDGKPLPIKIGPAKVLYSSPNADGSVGTWRFIEPSATSLEFLAKDILTTKQDLRELGRQPLTATSGNLTVITTAVAAGKAKSAVGAWALILKNSLENAMVITCMWLDIKKDVYDPEINVYTEFDNFAEGGADLEHLRAMRQNGDLSRATLWLETSRRRILSPEFNADEEIAKLLDELPTDINNVDGENDQLPE